MDVEEPQALSYWQCLSSLVNMYSHFMRGARPFVDPILSMMRKAKPPHKIRANASAKFAIQIWRVIIIMAMTNPASVAIPIHLYLGINKDVEPTASISDASPWRVCSALYNPSDKHLLAWGTYFWPYAQDILAQHQGHREYMGNLFTQLLLMKYSSLYPSSNVLCYQWVNDNVGAIKWVADNKCASLAVQYACLASTQLMMNAPIYMAAPGYKPGKEMGDIDTMSRIKISENESPTHPDIMATCPSLLPDRYIEVKSPLVDELFRLLDPSIVRVHERDHHLAYISVSAITNRIINAFALTRRDKSTST